MLRVFASALVWLAAVSALLSQETPSEEQAEQHLAGGAVLKTNPDARRLLERAEQLAREDRADLSAALFQKVLDEAGQALIVHKLIGPSGPTSTPLVVYRSLSEAAEQTLRKQPAAVLTAYRTSADAEARALLAAAGDRDEAALAQVVRRFFLSASGDDAAFALASLALDRHDFFTALAYLQRVANTHPDVSIPAAQLQARLAVAAAGVHDWTAAEQALAALRAAADAGESREVAELVAGEVAAARRRNLDESASGANEWAMAYGNPERTGRMPRLPAAAVAGDLAELASVVWPPPIAGLGTLDAGRGLAESSAANTALPSARAEALESARGDLTQLWRSGGWQPTGQLRFSGGRVYFKTADRLVCFDKSVLNEPVWQSAWQNRYELDPLTQRMALVASQFSGNLPRSASARPSSLAEILLFGDRVHQSLTIGGNDIYAIEGRRTTSVAMQPRQQAVPWSSTPRRTRSNWLTAYQLGGGKAVWTRSGGATDAESNAEVGFLAAPTPCGNALVVPVTDGGTIWLFGLDRETGRTLWTIYLCDEPPGGAPPWAEVVLAVSGQEVYLSCGCGVAFAIDTVERAIRWAVRYRRDGKVNTALRNVLGDAGSTLDFGGWDDDVTIPYGGVVMVMASDGNRVLALDRRTGERAWETPRSSSLGTEASYCLGVQGRGLLVAGKNAVRRYDVATGRLTQEREIADAFGRGCLTDDAIYLPSGNSILRFDPQLNAQAAVSQVAFSSDEPVGSLFSDGERLWVIGAARVVALTGLDDRLSELARRIAAKDALAQLDRMRLYLKLGRVEPALADLRAAFEQMRGELPAEQALQQLFAVLAEQHLPQQQPVFVLAHLAEVFGRPQPPNLSSESRQRLTDTLASCIAAIRQHDSPDAVRTLLAAAPLMREEYLLTAAAFAVDTIGGQADVPLLISTLDRGAPAAQYIAIRAAARLAPAESRRLLPKLLVGGDDRVRLAAARALVNLGERSNILETLVALLESPAAPIRARSQQTLQALTRERIPFAAEGAASDRASSVRAWRQWLQLNGRNARLATPLAESAVALGRILVVAPGALVEFDADHKERWRASLPGAGWGCQGLASGSRLVALNSHSSVVEYDEAGREVWKKDRLPAPPTSVQRLENGYTLVACGNAQQIVEIAPDGTLTRITVPGNPVSAQRLESGNTLVALQQPIQRVVEVDGSGKIVWEARAGGNPPWHAVRLENGNTLVTLAQARKVIELDPTGKSIVWSSQVPLLHPLAAQRLASGTTLVADQTGLREIDASGKEIVWQLRLPGVTGLSCY